jgi:hypothetical protein
MINILLSKPDFDEAWAQEYLIGILRKEMHVLILPLANDEGWAADGETFDHHYRKGSRHYENLVRPFRAYQIKDADILWFNPYKDDRKTLQNELKKSDAVFLCGNDPDAMMQCIEDHGIQEDLQQYQGILIGDASGSKIMMDEFFSEHEWNENAGRGLGLLKGFSLETGYIEDVMHLQHIIRSIEEKGRAVFGCPAKAGVLIQDGHYELMGDAFTCSEEDLDNIYRAYEDARSRQEYYGDNGGW